MKSCFSFFFVLALFAVISRSASAQWEKVNYPTGEIGFSYFFDDHGTLYTYYADLFRSNDQGVTWVADTVGLSQKGALDIIDVNGYLCVGNDSGVYVSPDKGFSWVRTLTAGRIDAIASTGDTLFAMSYSSSAPLPMLYRSTDNGSHWDTVNGVLPPDIDFFTYSDGTLIGLCPVGPSTLALSTDGGEHWSGQLLSSYPINEHLIGMASYGNYTFVLDSSIFISSDGGNSWERSIFPGDDGTFQWISGENGMLVAGPFNTGGPQQQNLGLYFSTDNAASWTAITQQGFTSSDLQIDYAVVSGNYIVAHVEETNGSSIWRLPLSDLAVEEPKSEAAPASLYPNPASNAINIPASMNATRVELIDMLGRTVLAQTIMGTGRVDVNKVSQGNYEAIVHTSSGVAMVPVVIQH